MPLSIKSLRGALISGAVLLVVVLAAYIGYGRYKAYVFYSNILKKNGISFTHDSNGITFSQSLQGRTVFTLRAARATPMGPGKWTLHDAELTLFGRTNQRADHISSAEIEWDEKEGVARALGEVHMDLQAPQALGGRAAPRSSAMPGGAAPAGPLAEAADVIHVRTSGLVYLRKLGVAATDQPVEFHYSDVECTARGAEFNSGESNLHLLADVVLDGQRQGHPIHLTAQRADLDRTANVASLLQPYVTSQGRSARATTAEINFRNDGSLQHLLARGEVLLSGPAQQIRAAELQAAFGTESAAQNASLRGGVALVGSDAQRPMNGSARQVDILFTPQGAPATVIATGAARLTMVDRRSYAAGLSRQMQGDRLVASFATGSRMAVGKQTSQLAAVEAMGSASAQGESLVASTRATPVSKPQLKTTEALADDLRLVFAPDVGGKAQPRQLLGTGHTHLQQDAPGNARQTSSGDTLQVSFTHDAEQPIAIESAVQTGKVAIFARPAERPGARVPPAVTTATADRASFERSSERLTLTGSARLTNQTSELVASTVVLDQRTGAADAQGHVQTTLTRAERDTSTRPSPPTHVLSDSAHFERDGRLAEFHGTDAVPARLWQQASQVQAANLLFDGDRRTFSARPAAPGSLIHAVFAGDPAAPPRAAARSGSRSGFAAANLVRVASPRMDYSDLEHKAVFAGSAPDSVELDSTSGRALATRAEVYLSPASKPRPSEPMATSAPANPLGGSLDRILLSGAVELLQPGRRATGEHLLYTAASGSYLLTGTVAQPPHIVDAQQGSLTGAQLLFSDAGSTIVVSGAPGPANPDASATGRVHTETPMKPQARP